MSYYLIEFLFNKEAALMLKIYWQVIFFKKVPFILQFSFFFARVYTLYIYLVITIS